MQTQTQTLTPTEKQLEKNNYEIANAYQLIINEAINLIRRFELTKYRTWINIEHAQGSKETHLIREFVTFFWNITLSSKDSKSFIFISYDETAIEKFGSALTAQLLRHAYQYTQSKNNKLNIEYALRVNFIPMDIHSFFYKRIVDGENNIVSIHTELHRTN